ALLRRGRADAERLVGEADVQRMHVGRGMDGDALDPELARSADDPERDLTPVGDENFRKRQAGSKRKSASPYSTGLPFWMRVSTRRPGRSAAISFISFIASTMQSTWPFFTTVPTSTNGGLSGEAER